MYCYKSLEGDTESLRLLVVEAGSTGDPIQTILKQVNLSDLEENSSSAEPIQGPATTDSSESSPTYETISYHWGEARHRAPIYVEGELLEIPTNAEAVIRRVRREDERRTIWIDSVCINQSDIKEREQQVKIMGSIYQHATQNIVWLGSGDSTTASGIATINLIYDDLRSETNDFVTFDRSIEPARTTSFSATHHLCPGDVQALLQFFRNPWFRRIWIIQEIALAKSNLCIIGAVELPLATVLRVAAWCRYKSPFLIGATESNDIFSIQSTINESLKCPSFLHNIADPVHGLFVQRVREGKSMSLVELFDLSGQFESTRAHDKVFGMLGLIDYFILAKEPEIKDLVLSLVPVDYGREFEDVERDATFACIVQTRFLMHLKHVRHRTTPAASTAQDLETPSWTMQLLEQWNEEIDSSVFPLWAYDAYPPQRARQEQPGHEPPQETNSANPEQRVVTVSSFFASSDPDILTLHGFPIDTVAETSAIITRHCLDTIDGMTEMIKQMRQMIRTAGLDDSIQEVLRAFAETLIARRHCEEDVYTDILDTFFDWAESVQVFPTSSFLTGGIETPSRTQLNAYRMQIVQNCANRRFFTTHTGRIGLGPSEMQPTDVIAVVQGSTMPLVLRPRGELATEVDLTGGEMRVRYYRRVVDGVDVAEEEYRFVGLAYVHGVMEGEAVRELRGRRVSERVFEVR